MFQSVERLAGTDVKHGDRLRLESYAYFVGGMSEAGQAVPVLQWHVRQAAAAKQRAMQAYVQQQLEHGKFWKLMEFSIVSQPFWLCHSVITTHPLFLAHHQAAVIVFIYCANDDIATESKCVHFVLFECNMMLTNKCDLYYDLT